MALAYSRNPGTRFDEAVQIARDGPEKIYYTNERVDLLRDYDDDEAQRLVTSLVCEVADNLKLVDMPEKKLLGVDSDIMAKEPPTDRYGKRIYAGVKERLGAMESKLYEGSDVMVIPRAIPRQRDAYYVFGSSGCGKSTWASQYAKEYLREFPGSNIYLFSCKERDPAFDNELPDLIRVTFDRNFVRECKKTATSDPLLRYANSLVIFDDFEQIEDPLIKKAVNHLKDCIFSMGRQHGINIVSIQHKGLGGHKTMAELCESSAIVCFPIANLGESKRLISKYLALEKMQMERIFDEDGRMERWISIIRPNIIVTPHYVKIVE